jgi:hypothetical protein
MECLDLLLLDGDVEKNEYLNKSMRQVEGMDDLQEWRDLKVRPFSLSFHFLSASRNR